MVLDLGQPIGHPVVEEILHAPLARPQGLQMLEDLLHHRIAAQEQQGRRSCEDEGRSRRRSSGGAGSRSGSRGRNEGLGAQGGLAAEESSNGIPPGGPSIGSGGPRTARAAGGLRGAAHSSSEEGFQGVELKSRLASSGSKHSAARELTGGSPG